MIFSKAKFIEYFRTLLRTDQSNATGHETDYTSVRLAHKRLRPCPAPHGTHVALSGPRPLRVRHGSAHAAPALRPVEVALVRLRVRLGRIHAGGGRQSAVAAAASPAAAGRLPERLLRLRQRQGVGLYEHMRRRSSVPTLQQVRSAAAGLRAHAWRLLPRLTRQEGAARPVDARQDPARGIPAQVRSGL